MFRNEGQSLLHELMKLDSRLAEDRIYEQVMAEIDQNDLDPAARAKAFEEAEGNHEKARALYVKHRVRRIRDLITEYEASAAAKAAEDAVKAEEDAAEEAVRRETMSLLSFKKLPPKRIQEMYIEEFRIFYRDWTGKDIARKYLPKSEPWKAFLEMKWK